MYEAFRPIAIHFVQAEMPDLSGRKRAPVSASGTGSRQPLDGWRARLCHHRVTEDYVDALWQ